MSSDAQRDAANAAAAANVAPPQPSAPDANGASAATPAIARRLACFVYEGVLLFGVLMIAGYLYSSLTQQRHALQGRGGLMAFLFVILAIYFTWFWSHGGQTVAMKAWHMRLVDAAGGAVTQSRAFVRYLVSWLWFLPGLALVYQAGLKTPSVVFAILTVGVLGYAALAWLRPDRQFWHDAVCGTRLVTWHPPRPARRAR